MKIIVSIAFVLLSQILFAKKSTENNAATNCKAVDHATIMIQLEQESLMEGNKFIVGFDEFTGYYKKQPADNCSAQDLRKNPSVVMHNEYLLTNAVKRSIVTSDAQIDGKQLVCILI